MVCGIIDSITFICGLMLSTKATIVIIILLFDKVTALNIVFMTSDYSIISALTKDVEYSNHFVVLNCQDERLICNVYRFS